jgi:uncharacterized protein (TIGR00369 family)
MLIKIHTLLASPCHTFYNDKEYFRFPINNNDPGALFMENTQRKTLPVSPSCFVCGAHNPAGLQGRFYVENDAVYMPLTIQDHHCGYPDVAHGGIVASALDECMAWAATRALGLMCVTGKLTVRYLLPTPAMEGLVVRAEVVKAHRRIAYTQAALTDDKGVVYATSEGSFTPLTPEQTLHIDDYLIYTGGEERLFDYLRKP